MEPSDLLRLVAGTLERLGIQYLVTGSMASIAYGEPRFTNDIDIVVRLTIDQARALCDALSPEGFYLSIEAAQEAVRLHGQFNAIHPESGLKIDFMVATDDDFNHSCFGRCRRLEISTACEVSFAAPEDVIVKKLQYFRDGGSDKHLRDIRGIVKLTGESLDRAYLSQWIDRLGLQAEWRDASRPIE